jgi:glucuronoarabinoxylan endo-1,4-beta-xylanase
LPSFDFIKGSIMACFASLGPNSAFYALSAVRLRTRRFLNTALFASLFLLFAGFGAARAQTATVDWTNVHQVIDGFGASDSQMRAPLTAAQQNLLFGTGAGQIGLSILRTGVPDGASSPDLPGDCSTVSTSCAGIYTSDMQAMVANGGIVIATPWSPPANYMSNGAILCSSGSGNAYLQPTYYGAYATWLANFVQSVKNYYNITLSAISVQNEPDICPTYEGALWTNTQIDTFVKSNLGPTFAADNLTTPIFIPETAGYGTINGGNGGGTCATDSLCYQFVSGYNFHDYDASLSGTNTVSPDPVPSDWASGKKYWSTEASCYTPGNVGPAFCQPGYVTNITDALNWAAVIDQRIAGDNANAWLYWWLYEYNSTDGLSLISDSTPYPKRLYAMGQYAKFVRPGYYRIDATRSPQSGVSVSAYQNTSTGSLVIIATNYTGSASSVTFNIANAPTFNSVTPTQTSATNSLTPLTSVTVSGNSFTYSLPAQSVTTFVGSSLAPSAPSNVSDSVVAK